MEGTQEHPISIEENEELKEELQEEKKIIKDEIINEDDRKCPICLCDYEIPAMLDHCFHEFCFTCILQWSQMGTKATCPLCKRDFISLVYDIRSENEYKRFFVIEALRQTKTKENKRELESKLISRWGPKKKKRIEEPISNANLPYSTAHVLRRAVYMRRIRAVPFSNQLLPSQGFSMKNYQANSSFWETKLRPWLTREIQALLEDEDVNIWVLHVLGMLKSKEIHSKEVMDNLRSWLCEHVEAFVHEFMVFANSPYDMERYDKLVSYDYSKAKQSSDKILTKKPQQQDESIKNEPISKEEQKNGKELHWLKRKISKLEDEIEQLEEEKKEVVSNINRLNSKLEKKLCH